MWKEQLKYIPTDAAKGEIEAYKEVIFKNYDSKLKNVAENEAAQKMYFKPETLNNNVEFVSASATDIATFTNNYKIQDKHPSIEKEFRKEFWNFPWATQVVVSVIWIIQEHWINWMNWFP